ncbi:hypothetical protein [Akkermansia glycaniphila]|uniref:Uncharacterized protein n=1 Tax=Akkermansia glycaniphila TaxID=1679444 RepID=A0A1C7PFA6_9BACT|nr:hypothetical protein [Akkermansia glycaniphila]OCA04260.1 hypothetical protein AC781_00815 [Akkermansia glycaniphila]SEH97198.1 Hypothetical protein PYTT_2194 [Akkermansia glycaniphila]
MCKPYDWFLRLVNTLRVVFATKEGVFALLIAVMLAGLYVLYTDMRSFITEQTRTQIETVRVLTELKAEISNLKHDR